MRATLEPCAHVHTAFLHRQAVVAMTARSHNVPVLFCCETYKVREHAKPDADAPRSKLVMCVRPLAVL